MTDDRISNAELLARAEDAPEASVMIEARQLQLGDHIVFRTGAIGLVIGVQHIYTNPGYKIEVQIDDSVGSGMQASLQFFSIEPIAVIRPQSIWCS